MTLEKLAEMTQQEFHEMGLRMDGMNIRVGGMDTRMDGINTRMDGMDKRMDGMVTKELFKEGMDLMLGEIRGVRQDVRSFRVDVAGPEERIEVLEEKTVGRQRVNV